LRPVLLLRRMGQSSGTSSTVRVGWLYSNSTCPPREGKFPQHEVHQFCNYERFRCSLWHSSHYLMTMTRQASTHQHDKLSTDQAATDSQASSSPSR
jgi:hypothetical protein